jgi:hypothetical protein
VTFYELKMLLLSPFGVGIRRLLQKDEPVVTVEIVEEEKSPTGSSAEQSEHVTKITTSS